MATQPPSIAHMKNSPNGAMKYSTYIEDLTPTTQASFEDLNEQTWTWTDSETQSPRDRESSEDLSKAMEDFAELVMPSNMMRQQHVQSVPMLKQGFPRKNEDKKQCSPKKNEDNKRCFPKKNEDKKQCGHR